MLGAAGALVGAVVLWTAYSVIGPGSTRDVAFAEMMDELSHQTSFRTTGKIIYGMPSPNGSIQYHQFEQTAQRISASDSNDSVRLKILLRLWQASGQSTPKVLASEIGFPAAIDFPGVLFSETIRGDLEGDIIRSKLFSPRGIEKISIYQFFFTGLPWMSKYAAENVLHHPAVTFRERKVKVANQVEKVFSLTVRDTMSHQIQWQFHVARGMRLPYRVEVTYRTRGNVATQADYVVDYPSTRG
jgi:hypothetical protein